MTPRYRHAVLCCIALLGCLYGCQRSIPPEQPNEQSQQSAALRDSPTEVPPTEISKQARVDALIARLAQAEAQREQLAQDRSAVAAQLATHQTSSTASLDKLKAEMAALQRREAQASTKGAPSSRAQTDAFSERARNQMEHALAMDQEYQTQLLQADEQLRQLDASVVAMRAEMQALTIDKRR
jgi:hypothetical protein